MHWSKTLIPTLRDIPQEAEIPSHQLMLRAGLIRKLSGGLYTFLPLGLRALRRVERIVREEMDRAGAIEVLMPALHPREIWDQSGRYEVLRDVMFRMRDRQDREMVLGPTHEEIVTDLVAHQINSYRQLPKTIYQIQTKFRDEIRPRFGLMRAKEFIMKDAYSFDADWEGVEQSYQAMYNAYTRIFERCGLRVKVVEADTGAMGGSSSHEFMVLADSGEDGLVECTGCAYAANLERAERMPPANESKGDPAPLCEVKTPHRRTVEEVAAFLHVRPEEMIKTLIYLCEEQPVAVLVPGNRELNEHKLARALEGRPIRMADEETVVKTTGAPLGFAGPAGLRIPVYADQELKTLRQHVAGANRADAHVIHLNLARDASVTAFFDLATAREGDMCPRCGASMREKRGIEVGHVFKLGTKYSERFQAQYLDAEGRRQTMIMGCYGIGVTRTLQAIIEQSHDEQGIVWPATVAPYAASLLVLNTEHAESLIVAEQLASALSACGLETLLDDRDERPGVKFKDADLIGLPLRIVVSERSLAEKKVEIKRRQEQAKTLIPVAEAVDYVRRMLS